MRYPLIPNTTVLVMGEVLPLELFLQSTTYARALSFNVGFGN